MAKSQLFNEYPRIKNLHQMKHIFWDADVSQIDIDKYKSYIIEKILDLGGKKETEWMLQHYSEDEIKHVLLSSRGLIKEQLEYWKKYFNIKDPPKKDPFSFENDSPDKNHRLENINHLQKIFEGSDLSMVDIDKYKKDIIERIFEVGNISEISWMIDKYSMAEIKEVLYVSKNLSQMSSQFWKEILANEK